MDVQQLQAQFFQFAKLLMDWLSSEAFYVQFGIVLLAVILAYSLASVLKTHAPLLNTPPKEGQLLFLRMGIYQLGDFIFPLLIILALAIGGDISLRVVGDSALVRVAESLAIIQVIYLFVRRYINSFFVRNIVKWIAIPVALLQVFGWLDPLTQYLESLSIELGNIKLSAYGVLRVVIFGAILFWLGRISNNVGQRVIRQQHTLDAGTREVFAKLYQVALFIVIFFLLLQIMGINITALAVFGGALGVGLGFGLQSIASNFISGIILLLDRSLAVGDYIELTDGRKGTIRELNMRSTLLETFDGKDIMVPNEQFITTSFVNWTHKNQKQRYSIELQVAYDTDLPPLFERLREVVSSHPKVLSGNNIALEERADAEIAGFAESGINILIEFWMEGIDDGENRVGGDLYLLIWELLKEMKVEIPYPHRHIKIVGANPTVS